MWHNEGSLRDVVVLNPNQYFVDPATIVICKLRPDLGDPTQHRRAVHDECQRICFDDWHFFIDHAVVTNQMLSIMWRGVDEEHRETLKRMCTKFGLFIPLNDDDSRPAVNRYLIPALLREKQDAIRFPNYWIKDRSSSLTAFIVFTPLSHVTKKYKVINFSVLKLIGFLPSGLFERIVGKALSWSQATSKQFSVTDATLHSNFVLLSFGNVRFSMCLDIASSCIRVDIQGRAASILDRLVGLTTESLNESMKMLNCFPAILHDTNNPGLVATNEDCITFFSGTLCDSLLVPLSVLNDIVSTHGVLNDKGMSRILMTESDVRMRYKYWLALTEDLASYDIFQSYRWGPLDSPLVDALFDCFTNYHITNENNRAVHVFNDKKRLKKGRKFTNDFAHALCNSTVFMPIVSVDALTKLCKHNSSEIDNVLLEWIIALECASSDYSPLSKIFPIFIGPRADVIGTVCSSIGDLFLSEQYRDIPTSIIPVTTLHLASRLLNENGITIKDTVRFHSRSVKSIIAELTDWNGFPTWLCLPNEYVGKITETCVDILLSALTNKKACLHNNGNNKTVQSDLSEKDCDYNRNKDHLPIVGRNMNYYYVINFIIVCTVCILLYIIIL